MDDDIVMETRTPSPREGFPSLDTIVSQCYNLYAECRNVHVLVAWDSVVLSVVAIDNNLSITEPIVSFMGAVIVLIV